MFRIKWKSLGTFLNELTWYTPPSKAASKKEGDDSVTGEEVSNVR